MSYFKKWYWGLTPEARKAFNQKRFIKGREYQAKYHQEHKEALNEKERIYASTFKGKEVRKRAIKKYYIKNHEWYLEYMKQWRVKQLLP